MATINYTKDVQSIDTSLDNVVIPLKLETAPIGGCVLDVTDWDESVIKAGHVVIKKDGEFKPLGVSEGAYVSVPSGWNVAGVMVSTRRKSEPQATLLIRGTVNEVAAPYAYTSTIKQALPLITFTQQ